MLVRLQLWLLAGGLVLSAGLVVLLVLVAAVRSAYRRHAELRRRVAVLRLIGARGPEPSARDRRRAWCWRGVCTLLFDYLPRLDGTAGQRLVRVLEDRGFLEVARRQAHRRRSTRRARAAAALGAAASDEGLAELLLLLEDRSYEVRTTAARSLGHLGHPASAPPLLRSLVRRRSVPPTIVVPALVELGHRGIGDLVRGIHARHDTVRGAAAEALGLAGIRWAIPHLAELLHHEPTAEVRKKAAVALGQLRGREALVALEHCVGTDLDGAVRAAAARALGIVGDARASDTLTRALRDPDHRVARNAAESLAELGPPGQLLLSLFAGHEEEAAAFAIEALVDARDRPLRQWQIKATPA